jgi:adenosine deaminase
MIPGYEKAETMLGLTTDQLKQAQRNALLQAFIPDETRKELLTQTN